MQKEKWREAGGMEYTEVTSITVVKLAHGFGPFSLAFALEES